MGDARVQEMDVSFYEEKLGFRLSILMKSLPVPVRAAYGQIAWRRDPSAVAFLGKTAYMNDMASMSITAVKSSPSPAS